MDTIGVGKGIFDRQRGRNGNVLVQQCLSLLSSSYVEDSR